MEFVFAYARGWDALQIVAVIALFVIIPMSFALVDFMEVIQRWLRRQHKSTWKPTQDFTILVPVFNDMRYLKNAQFLQRYADKVVLCTTEHETQEFYDALNAVCDTHSFRQHRGRIFTEETVDRSRNPWKIFNTALAHTDASDEQAADQTEIKESLLLSTATAISSEYVLFLDGDTTSEHNLEDVIGKFAARQYDLSSVRIVPSNLQTTIAQLQAIEYRIAMDARKVYPWMTSGACMIAKTSVLRQVLQHHSHFFQGGDIEIGKLAYLLGYNVGHISDEFVTAVPDTPRAWFRQRVAWSSGDFRHAIVNIGRMSWCHPVYFLYFTIVVYGLLPLRIWSIIHQPLVVPGVIAAYWLLMLILLPGYRSRHYLLFPIYSMVQSVVIVPLGVWYYIRTVVQGRNVGFIQIKEQQEVTSA